jgi:hypothetical protein
MIVGKSKGKRQLGRLKRKRLDNIEMDLGEIKWLGADWVGLDRDSFMRRGLVKAEMYLRVP